MKGPIDFFFLVSLVNFEMTNLLQFKAWKAFQYTINSIFLLYKYALYFFYGLKLT